MNKLISRIWLPRKHARPPPCLSWIEVCTIIPIADWLVELPPPASKQVFCTEILLLILEVSIEMSPLYLYAIRCFAGRCCQGYYYDFICTHIFGGVGRSLFARWMYYMEAKDKKKIEMFFVDFSVVFLNFLKFVQYDNVGNDKDNKDKHTNTIIVG